jgi:transcriptional regulator with XRE-family HTH domain
MAVANRRRRSDIRARTAAAADLERLMLDSGISTAALARAAKVDDSYLARILDGRVSPSLGTYGRLADAIGADLSLRLYPNTGPALRDRHQAGILETLLAMLHPRWHAFIEVAVRRPSKGWIDAALHDPRTSWLVATEIQSELRRLEQQIRWADEKAASLSSWEGFEHLGAPTVSKLLIVRRTRTTRAIADEHRHQLRTAYPADGRDAIVALTSATAAWPGAALLWGAGRGTAAEPWRVVAG